MNVNKECDFTRCLVETFVEEIHLRKDLVKLTCLLPRLVCVEQTHLLKVIKRGTCRCTSMNSCLITFKKRKRASNLLRRLNGCERKKKRSPIVYSPKQVPPAILIGKLTISDIIFPKNLTFSWLPKHLSVEMVLVF